MSFVVWKFPTGMAGKFEVPQNGRLVHAGLDPTGFPCVWIEVDPTAPTEWRRFAIFGTGQPITPGWLHCGSFVEQLFVWHVYEAPTVTDDPEPSDGGRDG